MTAASRLPGLPKPDWAGTARYGLLWGIASAAVESFALPLGEFRGTLLIQLVIQILIHWCTTGVTLAWSLMLFEHRGMGVHVIALVLGTCAILLEPLWLTRVVLGYFASDVLHILWGGLFYGGLFVLAFRLHVRSERIRGVLARAEIARQQTEAMLSAEQLKAMQGQVDPAFLLRVMTEVENRYGRYQVGVDRLLDALVAFLRAAMPGVRSGASTLLGEVQIAREYARVLAELEPGRSSWRIDDPASLPELPFPPLLLLPVLDRLASGSAHGIALGLRHAGAQCVVSLHRAEPCPCAWLGSELGYRLRVGLRATLGEAWSLDVGDGSAGPAFVLSMATSCSSPSNTHFLEDTHGHDAELL